MSSANPEPPLRVEQSAQSLRRMTLAALLLVLVQSGIGMAVNLDVAVPDHHPGAQPADYVTGSVRSLVWAIAHGPAGLAVHAVLGLLLLPISVNLAVRALRLRRTAVGAWAVVGALLVIGAGFNGASFLDFGKDTSSLIMALLAFAAAAAYAVVLFLLPAPRPAGRSEPGYEAG